MKLAIRDAKPEDGARIAVLMGELGYETTAAEMEKRLETILKDPAYTTLVATIDGKVCGMIGLFSQSSYEHNDPGGRILAMVVSKETRRSGVGRALIAAAEKDFASRGVKRIALTSRLTRNEAHLFYESLGYERTGWRFGKTLP